MLCAPCSCLFTCTNCLVHLIKNGEGEEQEDDDEEIGGCCELHVLALLHASTALGCPLVKNREGEEQEDDNESIGVFHIHPVRLLCFNLVAGADPAGDALVVICTWRVRGMLKLPSSLWALTLLPLLV